MNNRVPALLLLSLLALPVLVQAQPNSQLILQGRVTDSVTAEPLAGAHVFIAESMIGTTTDGDGRYELRGVPTGANRLYVSIIGFEPDFRDLMLRASRVYVFDFALAERVFEAGEVVIEAERDDKWLDRLRKFERMFIGETPNAEATTIVNPEVLDFEDKRGSFTAVATEPLIIENTALGYRIQYFLKDFESTPSRIRYDGEPLFEEMEPESAAQAAEWSARRREAFTGSFRHFALALIAGRSEAQGFKTYSRPSVTTTNPGTFDSGRAFNGQQRFPLDPASLLTPGESAGEHVLDFKGYVEVVYMGEKEDQAFLQWGANRGRITPGYQTSWITMERGPTVLDYKGDTLDPYGVTFMGYLAWERVANEVPKEYRP